MHSLKHAFVTAALIIALSGGAMAQATVQNKNPLLLDESYVTIAGTVGEIFDEDEFNLRYRNGTIKVDTNDTWPTLFRKDAVEMLKEGDRVVVTGVVDDNLFTRKEIDATSIYHSGQTYSRVYWPNTGYTGEWPYYGWDDNRYNESISVSGVVSRIINDDEFEMKFGSGTVKVDTGALNVIDATRLRVGDRVVVYGEMDDNWFGKRELDANYLVRSTIYKLR